MDFNNYISIVCSIFIFYQKKYEGKEIFSNDFEIDETSFLIWDSGQKSSKDFSHEDIVKLKKLAYKCKL